MTTAINITDDEGRLLARHEIEPQWGPAPKEATGDVHYTSPDEEPDQIGALFEDLYAMGERLRREDGITVEDLVEEWRKEDRYIGTGAACSHYRRCAEAAVENGEATPEIALEAYDRATSSMDRWHSFHRPQFS